MKLKRTELDGSWSCGSDIDAPLTSARRIQYADGRDEFVLEGTSNGTPWELHLRRRPPQSEFQGIYLYKHETEGYLVKMRLFHAEDGASLILVGTWENPGVEKLLFSISLEEEEE
jgi:hypothetical protein